LIMPSGSLQQMVYHRQSFVSVDELKRTIVEAWQKLYRNRSSTRASVNGIVVWSDCVVRQPADTLNSCSS